MKDAISSGLLEPLGGGIHCLSGSGKGTRGQRFDVLRVTDFGVSVDNFLSGFKELLSELSELEDLSFDERIA